MMGLPDSYQLPTNYNEAYHLLGDGLAVPAVSFVIKNIVEPALSTEALKQAA
jgi:DNA (cytosine-5)-methyltransferase 1